MQNNFYKIINNKYSKFFRFIFFLRYLVAIFFISIVLFLTIPKFFNYEKRSNLIKNHILNNYDFEMNEYEKIEFKALPFPRLEIKNVLIRPKSSPLKFKIKNLILYPKLISLYNYKNFYLNKIILKNVHTSLQVSDLRTLMSIYFQQKKKIFIKNLNLDVEDKSKQIAKIRNLKLANYGYNKNLITGKIFEKNFKIKIDKEYEIINFELLNSGVSATINLDKRKKIDLFSGIVKAKILSTNMKFNFKYDKKTLDIGNFYLRNKNFSFNNNSQINLYPYLEIETNFEIDEINLQAFKKANLSNFLKFKDIVKKINSNNKIYFKSKKFNRNSIDEIKINIASAYGRVNVKKKISFFDSHFDCKANVNLLEDYPLLFFDCSFLTQDKKKFLKHFNIKIKEKNKNLKIFIIGNINILNKKINFKTISVNKNYNASKEDLLYFKRAFEDLLFTQNFFDIFSLKKIREFIIEIS